MILMKFLLAMQAKTWSLHWKYFLYLFCDGWVRTSIGLTPLVDQNCWDILFNVHVNREESLEVEIFARFLQEFYDKMDLLFFLFVRSVISSKLHVNFKSRWTSSVANQTSSELGPGKGNSLSHQSYCLISSLTGKWLTFRECAYITRIVFGKENDSIHADFMNTLSPIMVGQLVSSPTGRSPHSTPAVRDTRRLNLDEFLHLAVLFYHRSVKELSPQDLQRGSSAQVAAREFPRLPGQSSTTCNLIPPSPYEGLFDLNRIPPTPTAKKPETPHPSPIPPRSTFSPPASTPTKPQSTQHLSQRPPPPSTAPHRMNFTSHQLPDSEETLTG